MDYETVGLDFDCSRECIKKDLMLRHWVDTLVVLMSYCFPESNVLIRFCM